MVIRTKRLILRDWCAEDMLPFSLLNADPRVMEYFPSTLTKDESDQLAERMRVKIAEKGWGCWAVSAPGVADFIGFIGLNLVDKENFPAPFTPAVEIGWRLAFDYWGKGFATEGALAALAYGFDTIGLKEIVAFTAIQNMRSRAVMERIGMQRNPDDDFDHSKLPDGHPLKRHVLYRIAHKDWLKKHKQQES